MLQGQSILITGAGGFLGSALAKSLAPANRLILLDSCEQSLFDLRRQLPAAQLHPILGSVEDSFLLDEVFSRHQLTTVFHAAAHKHVELLELNPFAAIRNNVFGTATLLQTALAHHCPSLIFISTDKAVRPRGIMGVSKRVAELFTTSLSTPACRMNSVRLVNVLGSTGSVLPIFEAQLAANRPFTVTHPDATRHFLSPGQTIDALLAAAGASFEGRILLPHLQPPTSIADLARSLSPQHPIEFIGLRPGEKLTEDLIAPNEVAAPHPLFTVLQPPKLSADTIFQTLECLATRDLAHLIAALQQLVPEYTPSELLAALPTESPAK